MPHDNEIMIWGHRGYQHHRKPEKYSNFAYQNSMPAFRFALTKVMGFESDVIKTNVPTLYLAHDTVLNIDKVSYELRNHLDEKSQGILGNRFIYQLSDEEADQLKLKDGEELPKLMNVFKEMQYYPERILNEEIKSPDVIEAAVKETEAAIEKGWIQANQAVFSSFNLPELKRLRQMKGDKFKIGALFSMKTQTKCKLYPDWPDAPQDAFYVPFNPVEEVLTSDIVKEIQPDYFHLERNSVTLEDIDMIVKHYPKAKVSLWCVGENHPDDNDDYINIIENLATSGRIYAVMSDFPEAVQEHCVKRGLNIKLPPPKLVA